MPRQIGEVDWHVDDRSKDIAAQALDILEWIQFREGVLPSVVLIMYTN